MEDCVFCNIARGKSDTKIEKESEHFVVFKDINPQSGLHLLIVPKDHIRDIDTLPDELWNEIKKIVTIMARDRSLRGYRLIHNAGDAASIPHMQVHFLADIAAADVSA